MSVAVKPYLRAIASGREPSGDLRITLLVSPVFQETPDTSTISLHAWPEEIRTYFAKKPEAADKYRIKIDFDDGTTVQPVPAVVDYLESSKDLSAVYAGINKAWQGAVAADPDDAVWKSLATTIRHSLQSASTKGAITDANPKAPGTDDGKHPAIAASEVAGGVISITSVIPVKQGDIAFHKEFERAAAVARRLAGLAQPETDPEPEMRGASAGVAERSADDLRKERWELEFDKLVMDTAKDRKNANDWWKGEKCAAADEKDHAALVAEVVAGTSKEAADAVSSHRYGYHPQTDAGPPKQVGEDATKDQAANAKLRMALAAYYAISSSPAWSRLFGFAVDVVVRSKDIPADLSGKLKVTVKADKIPGLPVVSTWAKLEKTGFWPTTSIDTCTDIRDGFIDLNTKTDTGDPRHELVTLDVRRAVEVDRFYGSVANERPQLFKSSGLTLIDRGRARAMVRTLSRAKQACDACGDSGPFEIDAEDLMVGMRLQIGLVRKDMTHWRSLAERSVDYRLDGDANPAKTARLIEIMLGKKGTPRRRMIDQSILTTATRLVPVTGTGEGVEREAIVEQALGTWDGSPMAVYCGEDSRALDAGDVLELGVSTELDLPTQRDLRLPPLRYGETYRKLARPVYPGGVSIVAGSIDERYATPARRFLRHEALGAPIVLLPEAIAVGSRPSPMDFERHLSAILRSAGGVIGNDPEDLKTAEPFIKGRQYVPLSTRLSGPDTIRVIIPPEASLDELLRHSSLDVLGTRAAMLEGGLKKVAFGLPPRFSSQDKPAPRFPSLVTKSRPGFDDGKIDLSRALGWSEQQSRRAPDGSDGAQGTGVFTGRSRTSHQHAPFRPDPAAEEMFIRFRYTGTSVVAGDAVVVENDKLGAYPNRKPVVLQVRKSNQTRANPKSGRPVTRISASTYDGIRIGAPGGEPVVVVEIELLRGDDFEADVFYLPSAEQLAKKFALIETLGALALAHQGKGPATKAGMTQADKPAVDPGISDCLKLLLAKAETPGGTPTTRGLAVPSNLKDVADVVVDKIKSQTNIPELSAFETIRLAHAVNRPFAAPQLQGISLLRPAARKGLGQDLPAAGTLRSRKWEEQSKIVEEAGTNVALTKDYLLRGQLKFHASTTGTIEIEAETVSPRDPVFDNPERKRSLRARLAGTWPRRFDLNGDRADATVRDVYGFQDIDPVTGKVSLATSRVTLLRIEFLGHPANLPADILKGIDAGGMAAIDLAFVHALARSGEVIVDEHGLPLLKALQVHAFPDGRARELLLRPISYSRFATDFQTAPFWDGEKARSRVLLRQELQQQELRQRGETQRVWLPSTVRPAKCDAEAPVPMISIERKPRHGEGAETVFELIRHAKTRVYLKRSWYSSGQGERVGLVVWPPTIFSAKAPTELNKVVLDHRAGQLDVTNLVDADLGVAGSFITRWGGDPIREDRAPSKETLMSKSVFIDADLDDVARASNPHDPEVRENVAVPIRLPGRTDDSPDAFVPLKASLLTYVPCFDTDREEWFVDIDLTTENATNPFVRFGLVRFQANSILGDIRVSEPIVVWSQLLPDRNLKVKTTMANGTLTVSNLTLTGPASVGIRELDISAEARDALRKQRIDDPNRNLRTPFVRTWLVHEVSDTSGVRRSPVHPRDVRYEMRGDNTKNIQTIWEFHDISVDAARLEELGEGKIYVYVEERDRRMPATYIDYPKPRAPSGQPSQSMAGKESKDPTRVIEPHSSHDTRSSHRTAREPVTEVDMFNNSTFVASGPSFSARIEIHDIQRPGSKPR
ncbi:hypothetical protein ASG39_00055 [Rhizobium sp. Leaf371]|uniref:hypothetical protein n=1 Tax=Rhizobium sp. Leaf371 TaxID=1736355 RepID=UPI0007163B8B|nr:hypothetical protein [Rhizobium sp. Leaf371]KQS72227.1 hypothetical protein ASG39_00055 [Rhizobium sp. Leaf371]